MSARLSHVVVDRLVELAVENARLKDAAAKPTGGGAVAYKGELLSDAEMRASAVAAVSAERDILAAEQIEYQADIGRLRTELSVMTAARDALVIERRELIDQRDGLIARAAELQNEIDKLHEALDLTEQARDLDDSMARTAADIAQIKADAKVRDNARRESVGLPPRQPEPGPLVAEAKKLLSKPRGGPGSKQWTDDRFDDLLRELWPQDLTARQIARRLTEIAPAGHPEFMHDHVYRRAEELRLPARRSGEVKPLSPMAARHGVKMLELAADHMSSDDIAAEINIGAGANDKVNAAIVRKVLVEMRGQQ